MRGMSDSVHRDAKLNNSWKRGKTRRQTGSSGAHNLESSSFTAAAGVWVQRHRRRRTARRGIIIPTEELTFCFQPWIHGLEFNDCLEIHLFHSGFRILCNLKTRSLSSVILQFFSWWWKWNGRLVTYFLRCCLHRRNPPIFCTASSCTQACGRCWSPTGLQRKTN